MYPVVIDLAARHCLVVGGGRIAVRKAIGLLRSGARAVVVAKECCRRMRTITPCVTLYERPYRESDVNRDFILVIGATNDPDVNKSVSRRAAEINVLCNIVDEPALCSFVVPAVVRRGDITVAVSTSATAPRLTRYLKTVVADAVGPVHGELAVYCGALRRRIRAAMPSIEIRNAFWQALFATDPVVEIQTAGWEQYRSKAEALIREYSRKAVSGE